MPMSGEQPGTKTSSFFGLTGRFGIYRNLFGEEQFERMRSSVDAGFERVSSSINDAAITIGDATYCGIIGGSAAAVILGGAMLALRRKPPNPQLLLMAKPKVDTLKIAQDLISTTTPVSLAARKKLELEGVCHSASAFCLKAARADVSKAFKNKLSTSTLEPEIKKLLSNIDFDLAPEQDCSDKNFTVENGVGLFYFYTLRSTVATCPRTKAPTVSIAFMLCSSKFQTLRKIASVKETTVTDPVYTFKYEPVLKSGGWISSFFRPNEYSIEQRKVYNGTITRTVKEPVFETESFSPEDVEALKAHMLRQAAEHAQSMLSPGKKNLELADAARDLE